jgi:hypothetical protein
MIVENNNVKQVFFFSTTVLQVINKYLKKRWEQEGTVSRRPIIIFLIAVNVIFNLINLNLFYTVVHR